MCVEGGHKTLPRSTFLVVEDDPRMLEALADFVGAFGDVETAGSVPEALDLLPTRAWAALCIDLKLHGDSGLKIVEQFRSYDGNTPAIILTGHTPVSAINDAARLDATYVVKPPPLDVLTQLFERAVERYNARLTGPLEAVPSTWELTEMDREVLALAIAGLTYEEIAARLGLSVSAVKRHTEAIRKQAGARSMREVIGQLLRRGQSR